MFREWIGRFISGTVFILYIIVGILRKNKESMICLQIQPLFMNDHHKKVVFGKFVVKTEVMLVMFVVKI